MHSIKYPAILALSSVLLTACGGGGGGGGSDASSASSDPASSSTVTTTTTTVNGSAVKGPVVGATVKAYPLNLNQANLKGNLLATGQTDANALVTNLSIDSSAGEVFLLEFTGGTDITTNAAPLVATLRTLITREQLAAGTPVFATPLSTFALELATKMAGNTSSTADFLASLDDAIDVTKKSFGLGENTGLLQNTDLFTTSPILSATGNQAETNNYRIAIEAFAALVLETKTAVTDSGVSITTNELLKALATDLADGAVNGLDQSASIAAFADLGSNATTIKSILLDILTQDPANLNVPGTSTPISNLISDLLPAELQTLGIDATITDLNTPALLAAVPGDDSDGDRIIDAADNYPLDPLNLTRGLQISWTAPDTRENGDALANTEIGGYEIYYYDENATLADATTIQVTGNNLSYDIAPGTLAAGTYQFAIATYDKDQLFSDTTPAVTVTIN